MPNYNQPRPYYCDVDLHARSLFINICDPTGTTRFEKNLPASPAAFLADRFAHIRARSSASPPTSSNPTTSRGIDRRPAF